MSDVQLLTLTLTLLAILGSMIGNRKSVEDMRDVLRAEMKGQSSELGAEMKAQSSELQAALQRIEYKLATSPKRRRIMARGWIGSRTNREPTTIEQESRIMALDWSQCDAVESIPGKVSGAWVLKGTRMPVSAIFENLEAGANIADIMEWFHVTEEEVKAVLQFATRSLDKPPSYG